MTTLYATVIKLIAQRDGSLPATQGRLAQAAFLDIIRAIDPTLSAELHQKNQRRPYTLSPLHGLGRPNRDKQIPIRRGKEVWLRVTLLGSDLFATFARYFLDANAVTSLPTIRLGAVEFAITEMLTTPDSHPWAGYTTLEQLCQQWPDDILNQTAHRITIEFASPTVFSRTSDKDGMGKFMEPVPHPAMFFGSVAARWNELTPASLDAAAIREYAEETIVVGLYRMQSKMFRYWGHPQIGATGKMTYLLKDKRDQAMLRTLNRLAEFAFYSGVGAKTAMGMGQVRRLP